jgi:hypothetical protein
MVNIETHHPSLVTSSFDRHARILAHLTVDQSPFSLEESRLAAAAKYEDYLRTV